jgi:hypothetical protein
LEYLVGNPKNSLFLLVVRKETTIGKNIFQRGRSPQERAGLDEQCLGASVRRAYGCRCSCRTAPDHDDVTRSSETHG